MDEVTRSLVLEKINSLSKLDLLKLALEAMDERLAAESHKVEFYDMAVDADSWMSMNEVAKILNFKGYGRNNLFEFLREAGVLRSNNEPYQRYVDAGYFRLIEQKWQGRDGDTNITWKTLVHPVKGIDFIRRLLNERLAEHYTGNN